MTLQDVGGHGIAEPVRPRARGGRQLGRDVEDESTAFSSFFRREYQAVLRTVVLVVRDRVRAEDVTQEAFMQLLRHWGRVSGYDRPDAWVRRVAIHQAMRQVRRERMRAVLERRTLLPPASSDAAERGLDEALQALTSGQRAAVVLHYYEDLPVEEVAHLMGCSPNTVKSHLRRGRIALRSVLEAATTELDGGHSGS